MDVKFPHITVKLVGKNGNAYYIMGLVNKALRANNVSQADIDAYMKDAMSSDYDHLLYVTQSTVNVD